MGVPAFFRWLSRKYPSIVVHCTEEKPKIVDGVKIPVDSSMPNLHDVEFDNLYLDMNGIIHPCCHPENKAAPKNEDEMMVAIFEYIDRIFSIVRPRRLLYMAIDGVAPRAKMNQQRSRRFRASKEGVEKSEEIARLRDELKSNGAELPPEKTKEEHFDSNCITPGTPFMARLAKCLHYYIHDRLNNYPGWKNIAVILSDANVPGEGEHKIMDYIRRQRANPDHDPNTRHCLCGADADLIMLGLATHEPNFTIIREEFKPNQPRPCELCSQLGHEMKNCTGAAKEKVGEFDELEKSIESDVEFIFIRLNVLREYLAKELTMTNLTFPFDLERAIDDWVFMCFFVGNDFLPHLPSLEIREGAIDRLVNLYKKIISKTGGFITDSGTVEMSRVQLIMTELGEVEDEIFKRRQQNELSFRQRQKDRKKRARLMNDKPAWIPGGQFSPMPISYTPAALRNVRQEACQMRILAMMKAENCDESNSQSTTGVKRKHVDEESDEDPADDVRLWEDGWKDRYYEIKFEAATDNLAFRHKVAAAYVEGLCWVLRYYYQGCPSWKWFFPYHYAPFASDFINVRDLCIEFEKGTQPFNPLEQLMAVFPAASRQHVPEPWAELMMDPESPIIECYPSDFKVDLNGKKFAWQGVALLPFVNEKMLLEALKGVYSLLTADEKKRNVRGSDRLYIRKGHGGYDYLLGLYENKNNKSVEIKINPKLFFGMQGTVVLYDDVVGPNETVLSPVAELPLLHGNAAVCINFTDPRYPEDYIFPAVRLQNAVDPPKVLKPGEMPISNDRSWRPQAGMARAKKRAYLGGAGHRMLDYNVGSNRSGCNEVQPPNNYMSGGHFVPQRAPAMNCRGSSLGMQHQHRWQNSSQQSSTLLNNNVSSNRSGYSEVSPPNNSTSGGYFFPQRAPAMSHSGSSFGMPHQHREQNSSQQSSYSSQNFYNEAPYFNYRDGSGEWGPFQSNHSNTDVVYGNNGSSHSGPANSSSYISQYDRSLWSSRYPRQNPDDDGRNQRDRINQQGRSYPSNASYRPRH